MYAMSPRAAFFSAHESVPADLAVGRVSAELVAPYPPGIPVLAPGELVTEALLAGLRAVAADGVRVAYAVRPDSGKARGRAGLNHPRLCALGSRGKRALRVPMPDVVAHAGTDPQNRYLPIGTTRYPPARRS